jgi:hypothetical protein
MQIRVTNTWEIFSCELAGSLWTKPFFSKDNFRQVLFEIIDSGLAEDFQITFVKNFTILIFSTKICKMHLTKLVTYLLLKLNSCLRFSGTFRQKTLMSIHDGRCYFKQKFLQIVKIATFKVKWVFHEILALKSKILCWIFFF